MGQQLRTAAPSTHEKKFRDLVTRWKADTRYTSSVTEMAVHPAYQQIIGMGESAVPLLLRELAENGGHWFWALGAITGEDPVPAESRGRIAEMTAAWLEWGRANGYQW